MSIERKHTPHSLIIRDDDMVFALPFNENSDEMIYLADDNFDSGTETPINLGGSWALLVDDEDALLTALETNQHQSPPTPPLRSIE